MIKKGWLFFDEVQHFQYKTKLTMMGRLKRKAEQRNLLKKKKIFP